MRTEESGTSARKAFVVVQENDLIAHDIVEALREYCAACEVVVFPDAERAVHGLQHCKALTAAIVAGPVNHLRDSGLVERLEALRGHIVLMEGVSEQPEAQRPGWHMLPVPFSTEILHEVIAVACRPRAAGPCGDEA